MLLAAYGYRCLPNMLTKHVRSWPTPFKPVPSKMTPVQIAAAMIRPLCQIAERSLSWRFICSACLCHGETLVDTARPAVPNGASKLRRYAAAERSVETERIAIVLWRIVGRIWAYRSATEPCAGSRRHARIGLNRFLQHPKLRRV
jgi:hypothetical protein